MGLERCYFVYGSVNIKELGHLRAGGVGCCLLRLYRVYAELNGTGFNSNN